MKERAYLFLAIIGFAAPWFFLVRFVSRNGLDLSLLIGRLFSNDISTFFAVDLVLSIIIFWFYLGSEARRLEMSNAWVYVLASLFVGLSFALPLFLCVRERSERSERKLEKK